MSFRSCLHEVLSEVVLLVGMLNNMIKGAVTNQVGQRENRQEVDDTSRIQLQKVFQIMHIVDAKRVLLEEAFLGSFFPRELREVKVISSIKQRKKAAMLIRDMDIAGLMIHVQQKQKGPALSFPSVPVPKNRDEFQNHNSQKFRATLAHSQGNVTQWGSKTPTYAKCGRSTQGHGNGNGGIRAQSFSVGPPDKVASRGATLGVGGRGNRLYAITNCQERKDLPNVDVVTDPGASLSFLTPYVAMNFDVLPEKLIELFSVSTPVGESILAERVYRGCTIFANHKSTMADLVELDMVDFNVILGMDWLDAYYASIDCRTQVVKLQFPNEPIIEWK
ncbi:hypothetical protein H5410_001188, partial [Solanum commersonii]